MRKLTAVGKALAATMGGAVGKLAKATVGEGGMGLTVGAGVEVGCALATDFMGGTVAMLIGVAVAVGWAGWVVANTTAVTKATGIAISFALVLLPLDFTSGLAVGG